MKKFQLHDYMVEPKGKIAKRVIFKDNNVLAFVLNIAKGESLPQHTHFDCSLMLQVIKGQAKVNVDEQSIMMNESDLVQLDGPEKMSVDNVGETTLNLYVTISPLPPNEGYSKDADI